MQLLECIVAKPGLLNNVKLIFDRGLTIIYGKNESGKSLIGKAIIDTLLGEFSGCFSLNGNTWDDLYSEILFDNSSGRYRFIRNKKESFLVRFLRYEDISLAEKEILKRNGRGEDTDGKAWDVRLFEATGDRGTIRLLNKVDMRTFLNIAYLPQFSGIDKNGMDHDVIRKFLINDSSNFFPLFENISEAFPDKAALNSVNPVLNEIREKERELNDVNKKIEILNIQNSKADRLYKEKIRLEQEIKKFERELSEKREYKRNLLEIQDNVRKLAEINKNIEEKNNEKKAEEEKIDSISKIEEGIKDQYSRFYNFEESNIKNLKKIQETYREIRDAHEEIENFYLKQSAGKNKLKNVILTINVVSILILVALFGISSLVFPIRLLNTYKFQFIIGLLTFSIFSSFIFLMFYMITMRGNDLKSIIKRKSDVEKRMQETLQQNGIILNDYKLEAIYEYLVKYFEEYGEYLISHSELVNMKETLNGKDYLKEIDDSLERLKAEENAIKQEIDNSLKSVKEGITAELDFEKINMLLQQANKKIINERENIERDRKLLSQTELEISQCADHNDEILKLVEEKNNIEPALKKLDNYRNSIEYIAVNLKEAIAIREEKQLARLAKTAGEHFHFLTGNQYEEQVNDDIIKSVIKGNKNERLNTSMLYSLYLSVKFAITDAFNDEVNIPLIIDEPFQQMDDHRIERLKKMLDDISPRRQIIIFTHSNKYKEWGSYIEL